MSISQISQIAMAQVGVDRKTVLLYIEFKIIGPGNIRFQEVRPLSVSCRHRTMAGVFSADPMAG